MTSPIKAITASTRRSRCRTAQTTDTVEVGGQFPDSNTMTGVLYAGEYPAQQYQLSFSLSRNGATPSPSAISKEARGLSPSLGDVSENFSGTAVFENPAIPQALYGMIIEQDLNSDDAFYAFVSPVFEVNVLVEPHLGNFPQDQVPFRNASYDGIHHTIIGQGQSSSASTVSMLSCNQNGTGWNCTVDVDDPYAVNFTPAASNN